jgi:hypothetical protein
MSFTTMKNPGPPIGESEIITLEKILGQEFPSGYREFLLKFNGGQPTESTFLLKGGRNEDEESIDSFHSIGSEIRGYDLAWNINTYRFRIPADLLPIACDPFGNQICIKLGKSDASSVCFWDHDQEHTPPTYLNVIKIADSFEQFLNDLYERAPIYLSEIDKAIRTNDVDLLSKLLTSNVDLEMPDEWGRTLIENAAIANAIDVIGYLFARGANLQNALEFAKKNAKFFPDHQQAVELLLKLKSESPK